MREASGLESSTDCAARKGKEMERNDETKPARLLPRRLEAGEVVANEQNRSSQQQFIEYRRLEIHSHDRLQPWTSREIAELWMEKAKAELRVRKEMNHGNNSNA